jgi:DNA mismatch repair protein MutS
VDRTTLRRLEVVERADGRPQGTLLGVLDETKTAMGGRLLREWLLSPLADRTAIEARHEGVEELVKDGFLRRDLRERLGAVRDVERILGKVATGRANARDLAALGRSLETLPALRGLLESAYSATLGALCARVEAFDDLADLLARAIDDDPPPGITEGGMLRAGFDPALDELRTLSRDAKDWIARYQARESERTGIPSLKVSYNRVFGYYIEITNVHRAKVPPEYVRKQTLTSAERYVTPELSEHEDRVLHADERARDLEHRRFLEIRDTVASRTPALQAVAEALAECDVLASLAEVAAARGYARPEMTDDRTLELREARHPVVEAALSGGERFVPNDTTLDAERRVALITGPNMAGKSTYIRQTALLVLMAQAGSFVPATKARIGVCDRIFARVGAEDDLAAGQSTFMVEMSEAAFILHHASERSLVILDEVGRGTSTFDGIAIAWALTEYLSEVVGARTLFATHYAELTALSRELAAVVNLNVAVREWEDSIVFLRRIQEGASDRSYGIHVAQLAGVPAAVVERARAVLTDLEGERDGTVERVAFGRARPSAPRDVQLGLFAPAPPDPLREEIRALDPDAMTPLEALNALAALVAKAKA